MRGLAGFILAASIVLAGCLRPPEYPVEPVIEFRQLSRDWMSQDQFNTDSLLITIHFTDGDGDIGTEEGTFDLFITDTRDNFMPPAYRLPKVPEQGTGNGISGEISFVLFTTCCFFPDGQDPCTVNPTYPTDTISYLIYIRDRAGHTSNVIETPPIVLLCD
ncbi:MAG: hypothetical protein J5I41_07815 [Saprospiraceae bacterium]|nr:hypothetical protein [Saprospiraceae bacterium]